METIVVDFGKMCRLCLAVKGKLVAIPVSKGEKRSQTESDKDLACKIISLTGIQIWDADLLPKWVCGECVAKLEEATEFTAQCLQSQTALLLGLYKELRTMGVTDTQIQIIMKEDRQNLLESVPDSEFCYEENLDSDSFEDGVNRTKEECPSMVHDVATDCDFLEKVTLKREEEVLLEEEEQENVLEEGAEDHTKEESISDPVDQDEAELMIQDNVCADCNKFFSTEKELLVHRVSVHHDDLFLEPNAASKTLVCLKCKAVLSSEEAYSLHLQCHEVRKQRLRTECQYCGHHVEADAWVGHFETAHRVSRPELIAPRSVDCRLCLRPFIRQSALCSHIVKHHPDSVEELAEVERLLIVWPCHECETVCGDQTELLRHYQMTHSSVPARVDHHRALQPPTETCDCGFIVGSELEDVVHHVLNHRARDRDLSCPACPLTCLSVDLLQRHLVDFHRFLWGGPDRACPLCGHPCADAGQLLRHLDEYHEIQVDVESVDAGHQNDPSLQIPPTSQAQDDEEKTPQPTQPIEGAQHKCPECSKTFLSKMNLHYHYKRRHLNLIRPYVCSYCGASLRGQVALKSHEDRLHRGVRSYQCPDCPEAFTTASILRKHSERHMADRPTLQCGQCGRKFTTVSGYSRHVQTHGGVKNFVCSHASCCKAFYTKSELRRHVKFHTQDLKHVCEVCGNKFVTPGEVRKHMARHTGERAYVCDLCPTAYSRRECKVKHMRLAHLQPPLTAV